jgi:hypothetical protein
MAFCYMRHLENREGSLLRAYLREPSEVTGNSYRISIGCAIGGFVETTGRRTPLSSLRIIAATAGAGTRLLPRRHGFGRQLSDI